MLKHLLILAGCLMLKPAFCGQCPGRDYLWNRIVYLRDSSGIPAGVQLGELMLYGREMQDCPYRNDSTHALLLSRIGWLFSLQKDFARAIEFTLNAIDIIQRHTRKPEINESHLIKYYNNLEILYDSTGQEKLKTAAMDSCISLSVKWNAGYPFSIKYINWKIQYLFEKGDYSNCLNYISLGEDMAGKAGYLPEDAYFYASWKINALIFQNRYEEADRWVEESLRESRGSGNKTNLGSLLGLKANIAEERGIPAEAILYARQSLFYDHKAANYSGCAGTWNNLGYKLYFLKLHQNDKALVCYKEALKYANANDSVYILDNMANVYVQQGAFDQAFYFFAQAFHKIHPGTDETNLLNNSGDDILNKTNAEFIINLVLDKAEAYLVRYKQSGNLQFIQMALIIYKTADQLLDKIKTVQTELTSKLFWRTNTRRLYERAIESCFLSGDQENAFYFFEKSRAALLIDQIREQQIPHADISRLAMVRKRILQLQRENTASDPASKQFSETQRALFINKQELSRIDQLIKEHSPWYYQSLIDTHFISLKAVQTSLLGDGRSQAILEFFNGDSAEYLLILTAGRASITRINKNDFEKLVERYMAYLSAPSLLNQDFNGFAETAGQLYQLLFKQDTLPVGRIIVSPDGRYFPLEAMITSTRSPEPVYFLNEHAVSYTYSVRYLVNDFSKSTGWPSGNFLGVAPVTYASFAHLASLPESDVSAEKIGSLFSKSQIFTSDRASKYNFMQQFQSYKIIQLYTHGSDSSGNGEPVIYFADSALYLSELIPENKTTTQLIVLSACETGNGKLYKGEGIFSFNRGFASLGIPSSVINLWSVDDQSTYRLTEFFYIYVAKGLPLDIALQKAKLDFIHAASGEKKLPYYWAAAIVAGKTDAIDTGKTFPWESLFILAGLTCLSLFLFLKLNRVYG
ncbi:MAG TPA: CHAT domain-containing protein [Puia sp.]|nr:CHAT domain-containing protein [Puia sp.]